jgi:hypothetical protein
MGQGSDLRLGKRTTLFMGVPVGSLASPDGRVRNPIVLAISQSMSFAFRRSTFNTMHLAKTGLGNPTKAPSFSQHVERNWRYDHGGLCGLARRNVDAVSARVAGLGARSGESGAQSA